MTAETRLSSYGTAPRSGTVPTPATPGVRGNGSHSSRTAQLTSAAIDARDFLRARENDKTQAHLPQGTLVAVTGSKPVENAQSICSALDQVRAKYNDMVLVHGGGPGAEKIAAPLGRVQGRPPGRLHGPTGTHTARPLRSRRNDQLLKLLPKGLISFPGSGISENLVDKATQLGIPVKRIAI